MCGEPNHHLLRYALANVLRACDLRGALTHIRPFPGIHAAKPHMIFRKNPDRILRKYHRCLRSENEFFMSRSMVPALRRSEIPGEQIARFVRWVYFALKRRGLRENTSCSMFVSRALLSKYLFPDCFLQGCATSLFLSSRKRGNHQRKFSGTPFRSRYSFLAASRSSSVGAVLYFL